MKLFMLPLSVVIPTYNREQSVLRAITSVLRQTKSCSELIVVDDGSEDKTLSTVAMVASSTNIPIRIFKQENRGPAAARNLGIIKSKYPFIAFLDSDDHWQKKKLEIQYEKLVSAKELLISHTKEKWLRRGVHLNQKKIHIPRNGYIYDHCLQLCAVGMSTVMLHKKIFDYVGMFDESLRCCEDYDLWLRISRRFDFLLIDKPLTVKEGGRDDQVSYQYRLGMDEFRIYCLKKILDEGVLDPGQHGQTLQELKKKALVFGNGCVKHGRVKLGQEILEMIEQYYCKALQKYPQIEEMLNE